jgi:glutathione S-transferase
MPHAGLQGVALAVRSKPAASLLFGKASVADAMYAPVCTGFKTYDMALDPVSQAYCDRILKLPAMQEWTKAAQLEPDDLEELDAEF